MRLVVFVSSLIPSLVSAQEDCFSSFQQFLFTFEVDRAAQQRNTIYPLKYSSVDLGAEPEPRLVDKPLSRAELVARDKPVYPSLAHQKEVPLAKKVERENGTRAIVHFQKPDTGYMLIYRFERIKGCWKLVEFEDHSM